MDQGNSGTARREAIGAIGATGLALLGAFGLSDASARKKRKNKKKGSRRARLATRFAFGEFSDPLPAASGSLVEASVLCGGTGKALSCGYQLGATASTALNTAVISVTPTDVLDGCVVSLLRTTDIGSAPGATIQATAICLE